MDHHYLTDDDTLQTSAVLLFWIAFALFCLHAFCDYELQAYQHGWQGSGLVDLTWRATKLPDPWDWIPRDTWHIVQVLRNLSVIVATAFATIAAPAIGRDLGLVRLRTAFIFASVIGMYAVAGGLCRSLVYRILN